MQYVTTEGSLRRRWARVNEFFQSKTRGRFYSFCLKTTEASPSFQRLPIPGSSIIRIYKGQKLEVKILEKGFEYNGKIYRSLTGVTKAITSSNWNAFNFFKL